MKAGNVQSQALIQIIKTRIPHTHLHSEQVAGYAVALAKATELPSKQINAIHISAMLHDVGKLGVSDEILTKAKDLTADEFFQMQLHCIMGEEILSGFSAFTGEAKVVRYHHERWDGKGYPDGLTGEEVPLASRIIHLADSIDAMLQPRHYKNAYPLDWVLGEIHHCGGSQFDPELVALALDWIRNGGLDLRPAVQAA